MKSTINLKAAEIILNGQTIETAEVKNQCQMWKTVKAAIATHGHAVRVLVKDAEDQPFMDITVKELANGKFNMVNNIKETRRSQQILAHRGTATPTTTKKKTAKEPEDWRKTGIVDGVKLRDIPVEGNGCWYGVGSDSYGYQIGKVADDGKSFEYLDERGNVVGTAVLVTNKRAVFKGCYCKMGADGKPYYYKSCGYYHGALGISDQPGCCQTYLDPSF